LARLLPFLVFFTVLCAVLFGGHYYLWARLVRDPGLTGPAARVLTATIAGLGIALPLTMIGSRLFQSEGSRPLAFLGFSWMGIGFIFTSLLLLGDASRLVVQAFYWLSGARGAGEGLADPARRLFFARTVALVVGAAGVGLSALGLREALGALRTKEVEVKLKGLPAALAGLRLVQISDVHVGPLLHKEWLQTVVEKIAGLRPDLVVITGDLVDGSVEQLREHVAPLARLQHSAPRGVYFVTGNHDYYSGADEWSAHLPTLGVRPLRNERVEVAPGLDLAGIDDLTDPGSRSGRNLTRALAGRDPQRPIVLLAHQPKQFLQAAQLGVDLTLSGHTHGGQIFPFTWLVRLQQPFVAGLHALGAAQLYVSRGTGFWGPPLRLAAPAEITLLKLVPA
jgi:predicted MPP superfamily phosphohydrolase